MIEKYIKLPWNWSQISRNPNLTMKMIEKYPNVSWDWSWVSCNPNISMKIIEENINSAKKKPWNWNTVSWNPNLTAKFIEKYPDKPWNWESISYNEFNKYNAAVKIQRFYKKNKALQRWKKKIYNSNMEILYNPKIPGIKFLEELELVVKEYGREF